SRVRLLLQTAVGSSMPRARGSRLSANCNFDANEVQAVSAFGIHLERVGRTSGLSSIVDFTSSYAAAIRLGIRDSCTPRNLAARLCVVVDGIHRVWHRGVRDCLLYDATSSHETTESRGEAATRTDSQTGGRQGGWGHDSSIAATLQQQRQSHQV